MGAVHKAVLQLEEAYQQYQALGEKKTSEDLVKIAKIIQNTLDQVADSRFNKDPSLAEKRIKERLTTILDKIDQEIGKNGAEIRQKIGKISEILFPSKEAKEHKTIEVNFGFILDVDAPDENGTMMYGALNMIKHESKIPFVSTRSILLGISKEPSQRKNSIRLIMQAELYQKKSEWAIFTSVNPEGEEFLFFLPRNAKLSSQELLQFYDLKTDGTVKEISVNEAFQIRSGEKKVEKLIDAFSSTPKKKKLFLVRGHGGGEDIMASLKGDSLTKFIAFGRAQGCLGMIVQSCFSGGAPSSLITPKKEKEPKEGPKKPFESSFENEYTQAPFPVLVRSIGDFPTNSEDIGIFDLAAEFKEALEKAKNRPDLQKRLAALNTISGASRLKAFLPADQADIPTGFRSYVEKGHDSESLTYVKSRGALIPEATKKRGEGALLPKTVHFTGKKFLDIYSSVHEGEVQFAEGNPILLSMVPGNGRHFIQKMTFVKGDPEKSIFATLQFHLTNGIGFNKAMFVTTMESKGRTLEGVILVMSPDGCYALFQEKGKFYQMGAEEEPLREVTEAFYLIQFTNSLWSASFLPTDEALRASTGGQEGDPGFAFIKTVRNSFIGQKLEGKLSIIDSFDKIQTAAEFIEKTSSFTKEELSDTVFELFSCAETLKGVERKKYLAWVEEAITSLVKEKKISISSRNIQGETLLCKAILGDCSQLVEALLHSGIDVNGVGQKGDTVLHLAVQKRNIDLVEKLIGFGAGLETKWHDIYTPLELAVKGKKWEIAEKLLEKGAQIDSLNSQGKSGLFYAIQRDDYEGIAFFLAHKADPNAGKPSPLTQASLQGDLKIIKQLVEAGGDPFGQDASGSIPLIEAILHGKEEVIKYLLTLSSRLASLEKAVDGSGLTPTLAALIVGDNILFEELVPFSAKNPSLEEAKKSSLPVEVLFHQILFANNLDLVEKLFRINRNFLLILALYAREYEGQFVVAKEIKLLLSFHLFIEKGNQVSADRMIDALLSSLKTSLNYDLLKTAMRMMDVERKTTLFSSLLRRGEIDTIASLYPKLTREETLLFFREIPLDNPELFRALSRAVPPAGLPLLAERAALCHSSEPFMELMQQGVPLKAGVLYNSLAHFVKQGDVASMAYCLKREKSFSHDEQVFLLQLASSQEAPMLQALLDEGLEPTERAVIEAHLIFHLLSQKEGKSAIALLVKRLGKFPQISKDERESIFKILLREDRRDECQLLQQLGLKISLDEFEAIKKLNKRYKKNGLMKTFEAMVSRG